MRPTRLVGSHWNNLTKLKIKFLTQVRVVVFDVIKKVLIGDVYGKMYAMRLNKDTIFNNKYTTNAYVIWFL